MITPTFQIGSKVRLRHDDGWSQPGCVMSLKGNRLRIYWPEENLFTCELPSDLVLYGKGVASQPQESAA